MSILIPVVVGAGLLLLASSKPAASKNAAPSSKKTALDFQTQIASALSLGNAAELMRIADEMDKAGLHAEAQALRASALALQNTASQPVLTPSPSLPNPPIAFPGVSLPPLIVPSSSPPPPGISITSDDQRRLAVAQAMAMNLRNTSRYSEDQALVKAFQNQEGLVVDGKYGPKSATALVAYGIVPPRPRYWTSKTMKADKNSYTAKMLEQARRDPTRAADWTAASKVQNDPVK